MSDDDKASNEVSVYIAFKNGSVLGPIRAEYSQPSKEGATRLVDAFSQYVSDGKQKKESFHMQYGRLSIDFSDVACISLSHEK